MTRSHWKNIEIEDVYSEGYIIVPKEGYSRYAIPHQLRLFENEESAQLSLERMIAEKKVRPGEQRIVRARLSHKRTVDVWDAPRLRLIASN